MLWQLLSVPFLIALNAFFVAAEYAVVATRPTHLQDLRSRGHASSAAAMERLKDKPASTIGAIQVCITITNLLLGWLGEPAMSELIRRLLGPLARAMPDQVFTVISVTLSFLVVTLLTVVFSELLPKTVTLRFVPTAAILTARPVQAIRAVIHPLVWLMNMMANLVTVPLRLGRVDQADEERVTVEELRLMTKEAAEDGELTPRERTLILNALTLADISVKQVMVPRVRVAYLDLKRGMEENRRVMGERLFSRLPLCDGGLDNIIGVIHTKEFLSAYNAAGDVAVLSLIARPSVFVPESLPIDKALSKAIETKSQILIVVDEYGGAAGIVTLRDIVNELIRVPGQQTAAPTAGAPIRFQIAADTPLRRMADQVGISDWCSDQSAATVGGLLFDRLGHIGVRGESVDVDGVKLTVQDADDRGVKSIVVERSTLNPPKPREA